MNSLAHQCVHHYGQRCNCCSHKAHGVLVLNITIVLEQAESVHIVCNDVRHCLEGTERCVDPDLRRQIVSPSPANTLISLQLLNSG